MDDKRLSLGEKVKGFLGDPVNTFNNVQAEALGSAVKYFAIWVVVYAILWTVIFYTVERQAFQALWDSLGLSGAPVYLSNPVIFGLLAVVGGFAGLFIGGLWTHLFVRAFGGRKGYRNTLKAFAYGYTPTFLFGWLPFVGPLFSIWALILNIIGIRQLHGISTGRAVGAVLLGIVVLAIIVVLIMLVVVLLTVFPEAA
jgi:hypothetical protein